MNGQDLSGVWTGTGKTSDQEAYFELSLVQSDSVLTGVTYLRFSNGNYQKFALKGTFHSYNGSIEFTETKILESKKGPFDVNCWGKYNLRLTRSGDQFILKGNSLNYMKFMHILCANAAIVVSKPVPDEPARNDAPEKDPIIAPKNSSASMLTRNENLLEIINTKEDSVSVDLFDNGEIDGDSVSIFLNDSIYLSHVYLGATPLRFSIPLTRDNNKLTFSAENLGRIPPNTGTLIIHTPEKEYTIRLSADYSKNCSIRLIKTE